jgi:Tol biopolymer transport system component
MKPANIFVSVVGIVVIAAGLAAGCATAPGSNVNTALSPSPSPTHMLLESPTVTPLPATIATAPQIEATITPRIVPSTIPSPSATPHPPVTRQCLEILADVARGTIVNGNIVVSGFGFGGDETFLLDANTGDRIALPLDDPRSLVSSEQVSPDHVWLAYRERENDDTAASGSAQSWLVVVGGDGQRAARIPWDASWRHIAGWLDDSHLLVSKVRTWDPEDTNTYDSLIVLDPFSGQELRELVPDYPGIRASPPDPLWGGFQASKTVYDPDLSRVIYPGLTDPRDNVRLFLHDLNTGETVTIITGTVSAGVVPKWSPGGEQFIISGPATLLAEESPRDDLHNRQELYSVARDGAITRLTNLTEHFRHVSFDDYDWSPDGAYVALSLRAEPVRYPDWYPTTSPTTAGRLVILDMTTGAIIEFCVPHGFTRTAPIWSPDSRQLAFEDYYQATPPLKSKVYVIDIKSALAVEVAEDASPVGWLAAEP